MKEYLDYLKNFPSLVFPKIPSHITFFITGRCNLRCKMCFYWQNIDNADIRKELTIEEIKKISKNFNRVIWLSITGGEPFLRNDVYEIVECFYKNNNVKNVSIYTNGFFPQRVIETVKRIMDNLKDCFLTINISIDGPKELHDEIRGIKGSFERCIITLKLLEELRKEYKKLCIGIIYTMNSLNEDYVEETFNTLKSKVYFDSFYVNFTRGNPRDPSTKNFSILKYLNAHKFLKKMIECGVINQNGYPFSSFKFVASNILTPKYLVKIVSGNKVPFKTKAGKLSVVIGEYGDVWASESISESLGNLRDFDYNIKLLLRSRKAINIIKKIDNNSIAHECNIVPDILSNISTYPILFKELFSLYLLKLIKK